MKNFQEHQLNGPMAPAELKALQDQLDAASTRHKGPRIESKWTSGAYQADLGNGKTTVTHLAKTVGHATSPTPPGMVAVPGMGYTPIEAAIAGGLLPEGWKQGDPTPFDKPSDGRTTGTPAEGNKNKAPGTPEGADSLTASPEFAARKAAVDAAGQILVEADKGMGAEAVDGLLHMAADAGGLTEDQYPEGVTEEMARKVHAGFVAQADNTLAEVRSSVKGLESMLTPAELKTARHAVIGGDKAQLQELGRVSVQRLAQLPQRDPEGFAGLVEMLTPAERKAIHYNEQRREWIVTHPKYGPVSFGTAVNLGIVRF